MSFVQLKDENGSAIIPNAPLPIVEIQGSSGTIALDSGYVYIAGVLTALTFTLTAPSDPDYAAEYHLIFTTHSNGINITWPQNLIFEGATQAPTLEANTTYKIEIIDILCSVSVFGVDTDYHPFVGATSSTNGSEGLVPAPNAGDEDKVLKGNGTWGVFIPQLTELSYGHSTWNDFLTAYSNHSIVYCRASSNSNPGTGSQTRRAFMAYVDDNDNPTNVEFQYFRSQASHSNNQQGDQMFVYKLTNAGTWTVQTRNIFTKIVAGTNMSSSYASNTLTLNAVDTTYTDFTGADPINPGSAGLVPAPAAGDQDKFLKGDGTWGNAGGSGGIGASVIGGYNPSYVNITDPNNNILIPFSTDPTEHITGDPNPILSLEPNIIYVCDTLDSLTFTLNPPQYNPNGDYNDEYFISFESGATPTTVTWPGGLIFANNSSAPTIVDNAHYEISIRDNLCIVQVFGVNTGGGGGGGGSVTFDEVGSYTPKFGNLRDNGNLILPHTLKPIVAVSGSTPTVAMDDGYVYVCGAITELTFTLTASQISDYVAEYEIRFESGSTATEINWPTGLTFENRPVIEPNSYTHIKITDGNVKCFNYADVSAYTVGTNARVSFDTLTYQQIYDIVENA